MGKDLPMLEYRLEDQPQGLPAGTSIHDVWRLVKLRGLYIAAIKQFSRNQFYGTKLKGHRLASQDEVVIMLKQSPDNPLIYPLSRFAKDAHIFWIKVDLRDEVANAQRFERIKLQLHSLTLEQLHGFFKDDGAESDKEFLWNFHQSSHSS